MAALTGVVSDALDAVVPVTTRGSGAEFGLSAVVDTGFSEFLIVPIDILRATGATSEGEGEVTLGNREVAVFETYPVEVRWLGEWRRIVAYASEGEALVGMKLLLGCDLFVRVMPSGEVRIAAV